MSEEFFERLHDRAHNKYPKMLHGDWADGIDATIEALKEMMVGKLIVIRPVKSVARRIFIQAIEKAGRKGEQVAVMVFNYNKEEKDE